MRKPMVLKLEKNDPIAGELKAEQKLFDDFGAEKTRRTEEKDRAVQAYLVNSRTPNGDEIRRAAIDLLGGRVAGRLIQRADIEQLDNEISLLDRAIIEQSARLSAVQAKVTGKIH